MYCRIGGGIEAKEREKKTHENVGEREKAKEEWAAEGVGNRLAAYGVQHRVGWSLTMYWGIMLAREDFLS